MPRRYPPALPRFDERSPPASSCPPRALCGGLRGRRRRAPAPWAARLVTAVTALALAAAGCQSGPSGPVELAPSAAPSAGGEARAGAPREDRAPGLLDRLQPPRRELTADLPWGGSHGYEVDLASDQYLELWLDRSERELEVVLLPPGTPPGAPYGAAYTVGEFCFEPHGQRLWAVAEEAGRYRLEIRRGQPRQDPLQSLSHRPALPDRLPYRLRLETLEPAGEREWARYRGLRGHERAQRLARDGRVDEALTLYGEAVTWSRSGDYPRGAAASLNNIGRLHEGEENWPRALSAYLQSLEAWEEVGDPAAMAGIHTRLGRAYRKLGQLDTASEHLSKAVELSREARAHDTTAAALNLQCLVDLDQERTANARARCHQAIDLWEMLERPDQARQPLLNLGQALQILGELDAARGYYQQALELNERVTPPDPFFRAIVLSNFATLYDLSGEYQQALTHAQESLPGLQQGEDWSHYAQTLFNIGTYYQRLGDTESTRRYYRRALEIREQIGDEPGRINTLQGLGWLDREEGLFDAARRSLDEALVLARHVGIRPLISSSLDRLGELSLAEGRLEDAHGYLSEALALEKSSGGNPLRQAHLHRDLALVYRAQGLFDRALEALEPALRIQREIGHRSGHAESLFQRAQIERLQSGCGARPSDAPPSDGPCDGEQRLRALATMEHCLEILDTARSRAGGHTARALFAATKRPYYEFYVDLLMELHRDAPEGGYAARALAASEEARARSLLETLAQARAEPSDDQVPAALLAERRELRDRLDATELRRSEVTARGEASPEELFQLKVSLETQLNHLRQVEAQIRAASPRYAALTQPPAVTLETLQEELLDEDTVLLEYSLGERRSFLWVVTPAHLDWYELPGREALETSARCLHWLLTAHPQPPAAEALGEDDLHCLGESSAAYLGAEDEVPLRRRRLRRDVIARVFEGVAGRLSETLLGPPARDGRLEALRWAVVSDGGLEYVPFAALPDPAHPQGQPVPLAASHQLVRLPSASVVLLRRQEGHQRGTAPHQLAVIADPVYSLEDARLREARPDGSRSGLAGSPASAASPAGADGEAPPGPSFRRLYYSTEEARSILDLARPEETFQALGFEATREAALDPRLGSYRYVHFAAHGLIDSRYPELSSLVLSLVEPDGTPRPDGYLRLHDIYNMELRADLVVLSACETALGREIQGEGLVGLTRGFLYAGADRVVASLWRVQDLATSEFMKRFYDGLLRQELAPAEALRRAQMSMVTDPQADYRFPSYWAGFVLQGEWR